MTKKEFKRALLRGQGRCLQAARRDPEKYREEVLWACKNDLSFDTQSEGTRAWLTYRLVRCYEDPMPFVEAAAEALKKTRSDGGWRMQYLSELLQFFVLDEGMNFAKDALWGKYEQLYAALLGRKRRKTGIFPELDDFEMLIVTLSADRESFLKIAEDVGELYRQRPFYNGLDFSWLYDCKGKYYMTPLRNKAKTSGAVTAYLEEHDRRERESEERLEQRLREGRKGLKLSLWLAEPEQETERLRHARAYEEKKDPIKRAEALEAFCGCPYPLDPAPLLEDIRSDCGELKAAAWRALENTRHPAVREFALKHLQKAPAETIPLLATNYLPEDEALLTQAVKAIPTDRRERYDWHGVQLDVLRMEESGLKAPAALLEHIYETSYCSCCREFALRQMGKRRMLTEKRLKECLLDSDDDIRAYAKRCLNRRRKRKT